MLTKSDNLDKFGAAMAKVQEAIGCAIKGSVNPHFKNKYADLTAVWETWQAVGPANGFSVMQFPGHYDAEGKSMAMDQIVIHSSGQWVQSELSIPLSKADAQAYGSANTYARRYSLAAAVGICPDDDDGNAASSRAPQREQSQESVSAEQAAELRRLVKEARTDEPTFCKQGGVSKIENIAASDFEAAKGLLVRRIETIRSREQEKEAA
jgi:hypothetical protein